MSEKRIKGIFGYWCHKIIPLIYDDSLSYYECLCKVLAKLNEVIDTVNGLIDGDIEGYLKNLIDEYTIEEVTKLINEIGEPMVREMAEEAVETALGEWTARLENLENTVIGISDEVDSIGDEIEEIEEYGYNLGSRRGLFNREYYLWCGNPSVDSNLIDSNDSLMNKCDLVLVDDNYYYLFANNSDNFKIVKVAKTGYSIDYSLEMDCQYYGFGHGMIDNNHLYGLLNSSKAIAVFDKITSENNNAPKYANKTYNRGTNAFPIGRIAYDAVNDKYYACGTMADSNNYDVYELTFNENTYDTTFLFNYSSKVIMGIPQNMCCNDGILYIAVSNPNQILCVSIEQQKIISVIDVEDRLDYILPVGELQAIDYNDGKLYIGGYNAVCISGVKYLNCIGSIDLKTGSIANNQTITRSPSYNNNRTCYVMYVDRYREGSPTNSNDHGLAYDRYKNACGWFGGYDYLPFYNLWEAVEASVGMFAKTGIKSIINLNYQTSASGTIVWGETVIPSWAIDSVNGRTPSSNVYATVRFLAVIGGSQVSINRIGFVGNRGDIGYDNIGFIRVEGSNVMLSDCAFLRISNTIIDDTFRALMYCEDNGSIICGAFHTPISDFHQGGGDWVDHIPSGVYFAEVIAGNINFAVGGNSDYVNMDSSYFRRTALGYLNAVQE